MKQHSEKIAENLYAIAAEKMKPLVVVVDKHNNYVSHYGNLSHYQLPNFEIGSNCLEEFQFLAGLEDETYIALPLVNLKNNNVASVNIITINQNRYVLILDAKSEYLRQQQTTQVSNETRLLNIKLRKLTEQLQDAQKDLVKNNELLKLANNVKSRFISGMSHEFRTPISSILGYSNVLANNYSPDDEEYRRIKAIERNAQYLLSLIDNVLEHAQLEEDKLLISIAPVKINELINDIKQMFAAHAENTGLLFHLEVSSGVPNLIYTDQIRLQQILINLLGNAFQYTQKGEVQTKIDWENDILCVTVKDTGPGISDKDQALIFQAYNRGDSKRKKGAGLGLAISSRLAKKLEGNLVLSSKLGEGSIFTLTVRAPRAELFSKHETLRSSNTTSCNVLIVEDDDDLVELLKIYLHDHGHKTFIAYDGEEALKQYKTNQIDLVILDMQLPNLDGTVVAKKLIELDSKTPIIGMTASMNIDDKVNALKAGCSEFLTKPIQVTTLIETINKLLTVNA